MVHMHYVHVFIISKIIILSDYDLLVRKSTELHTCRRACATSSYMCCVGFLMDRRLGSISTLPFFCPDRNRIYVLVRLTDMQGILAPWLAC